MVGNLEIVEEVETLVAETGGSMSRFIQLLVN